MSDKNDTDVMIVTEQEGADDIKEDTKEKDESKVTPPIAFRSQAIPDFISDRIMEEAEKPDEKTPCEDDEDGFLTRIADAIDDAKSYVLQIPEDDIIETVAGRTASVLVPAMDDAISSLYATSYWQDDGYSLVSSVLGYETGNTTDTSISTELVTSWNGIPTAIRAGIGDGWLMTLASKVGTDDDDMFELVSGISEMFHCLSDLLCDARHSSIGYPDYAYHDEHERPHIAPYDDEWENGQMLGTVTTFKSAMREVKRDGKTLYAIKTRGELSCPWCAWVEDIEYAEDTFRLVSDMMGYGNVALMTSLSSEDVTKVQETAEKAWEWVGRHLADLGA